MTDTHKTTTPGCNSGPTGFPGKPGPASAPVDGDLRPTHIKLLKHEIQSNYDRVQWAEGLIKQLPETHEGRNSWLLNYEGEKHKADKVSLALLPARTPEPDADVVERAAGNILDDWFADRFRADPEFLAEAKRRIARATLKAANLLRTPAGRPDREAVARIASKLDRLEEYLIGKDLDFELPHGDPDFSPSIIANEVRALALYPAAPSDAEAVREACANICKAQKEHYDAQRDTCIRKTEEYHFYDQQAAVAARCEADIRALPIPPAPARGEEHHLSAAEQEVFHAALEASVKVVDPSPSSPSAEYVLVPREPTSDMVNEVRAVYAAWKSRDDGWPLQRLARDLWEAMLTAAPRKAQEPKS